jgi:thiamine pyrophosphokinase
LRAVIIANGVLSDPDAARTAIHSGDLLIAADGGGHHCREMGLTPAVLIGDFDSLEGAELTLFENAGTEIIRHPARKDFTDLELAIRHAQEMGAGEIVVLAALGSRWDQSLANLLMPATADFQELQISLMDGPQEIMLLRGTRTKSGPAQLEIIGQPGDTVSLIPLGGDARGITTHELEYPLANETLFFGTTRGISNVMLSKKASISLEEGMLLCTIIHAHF